MEIKPLKIEYYYARDGRVPYREWFYSLKDMKTRQIIIARLTRVERGLLGDSKSIGSGVHELRIDKGPGYRIYFGRQGDHVILLLLGGTKSSQRKDIEKAHDYWVDYLRRQG